MTLSILNFTHQNYRYLTKKALFTIASVTLALQQVHALETLQDEDLAGVSGNSGIVLEATTSKLTATRMYWQDNTTDTTKSRFVLLNPTVVRDNSSTPADLSAQIKLNMGANPSTMAISTDFKLSPFLLNTDLTRNTYGATFSTAGSSYGRLGAMSLGDTVFSYKGRGGIFNSNGPSEINLQLNGLNLYLQQDSNGSTSQINQLILGDIFANVTASGKTWINANGLQFAGNVLLQPVQSGRAGAEVSVKYNPAASLASNATQYAYNTTTKDSKGGSIIRLGATGLLTNTQFSLNGTNASTATGADLGLTSTFLGDQGFVVALSGEMTRGSASPFSWELGEAGTNNYSLQFNNLVPFNNVQATTNPTVGLGQLYLNQLVPTSNAKWSLNNNGVLTGTNLNSLKGYTSPKSVLSATDYEQTLPSTTAALLVQMRGAGWQGVPQNTLFVQNGTGVKTAAGSWALAPLMYGLDANVALSGAGTKNNLSFQVQTKGVDSTGLSTTSLLLVDTASGVTKNTYLGFRNIDLFASGSGTLVMSPTELQLNIPNFVLGLDTQLAMGYLPGAQVYNSGGTPIRLAGGFGSATKSDVLYGLRSRIDGDLQLWIDPFSAGALKFDTTLKLKPNSFIHVIEPTDSSTFGLDQVSGTVKLDNTTVDLSVSNGIGSANFSSTLVFNPNFSNTEIFKVGQMNLYPTGSTTPQTLMQAVIPGGQIAANMTITPR